MAERTISGKYRLLRLLGEGGAGSVWEAENMLVGRHVAIKILHPNVAAHPAARQRFLAEAQLSAKIAHPNVVDIYDLGTTEEGTPYIVMELLEGETLESIIIRRGRVPPQYACGLMLQVLGTLVAAHDLNIVHRDLKPANIVVVHPRPDRPVAKVLDFGVAQGMMSDEGALDKAEAGLLFGTPEYMAPEQAKGGIVDSRCDIYAAGAILYELLGGQPPVFGESATTVLARLLTFDPVPIATLAPTTPPPLADAIMSALAREPHNRPRSARAFISLVKPFAAPTTSFMPPSMTEHPLALLQSKKRAGPSGPKRKPRLQLVMQSSIPPPKPRSSKPPGGHRGPNKP
jgi:eukaryotic-like serine/threonine-protein kinase